SRGPPRPRQRRPTRRSEPRRTASMLEVGFWELVMIGLVALIVVGPEKLPRLARTAGRWVAQARRMAANVRAEIESELAMEEIRRAAQETASPLRDVAEDLRTSTSVPPDYGVA